MGQIDNTPVSVTGDERRHPAIRLLARAAIELARQQLAQGTTATEQPTDEPNAPPVPAEKEVQDA